MLKIFAKEGTDEKALVMCTRAHAGEARIILTHKYGGDWRLVDKLHTYSEILHFNDGQVYNGHLGVGERNCKAISEVSPRLLNEIQQ